MAIHMLEYGLQAIEIEMLLLFVSESRSWSRSSPHRKEMGL